MSHRPSAWRSGKPVLTGLSIVDDCPVLSDGMRAGMRSGKLGGTLAAEERANDCGECCDWPGEHRQNLNAGYGNVAVRVATVAVAGRTGRRAEWAGRQAGSSCSSITVRVTPILVCPSPSLPPLAPPLLPSSPSSDVLQSQRPARSIPPGL
ncbi:hypothetical protein DAEQUDRAFT_82177 [Daedalea quercina L-15889]|uniref:Uncharacterized protein n=1 Tax=Daedalea quercina L-15889 TaxID=1314783 RepID=A0A165SHL0_9APHY|nr:hypothetical protein DAEQUDRAFT_82177 [Daedalea quercina L-15889]